VGPEEMNMGKAKNMGPEVADPKRPTCCFCRQLVEVKRTDAGEIYWQMGESPAPLVEDPEARCCSSCNVERVLPVRIMMLGHMRREQG
jgi:hypothetical protein